MKLGRLLDSWLWAEIWELWWDFQEGSVVKLSICIFWFGFNFFEVFLKSKFKVFC
jgi:hypothetical protein